MKMVRCLSKGERPVSSKPHKKRTGRKDVDDLLALHLAQGFSVAKAAELAGVCADTVYRRLKLPEFRARVQRHRDEIFRRDADQLASLAGKSVLTLHALLDSRNDAVRLGAARTVLDTAVKFREQFELAERIMELEHQFHSK